MFQSKTLMITGGTGSFGKSVLKRFLKSDVDQIRIFSRDEKKQEDMRNEFQSEKLKFHIGDVRDYESVSQAMQGVDFVFHAAALKQVPSCEFYPLEAVKTNILGTENVLKAANSNNVEKVIVLSTDKAVYPINTMGMSKALAEKVVIAKSRSQTDKDTIFCCTRYGNVMASRGSVIPLFVSQIKNYTKMTITDPSMTRFLMSLDESVDLVLHAFEHGKQGDIFVQKAPAATVADLVKALSELFSHENGSKIIGTRHGEKLYETLISREEMFRAEEMDRYFRISADNRDLNYSKYFSQGSRQISNFEDYTSHNTKRLFVPEIKKVLLELDFIRAALDD